MAAAGLETVRRVYAFWGRHPFLYGFQDYATFLGRPHTVRSAAVAALALKPGASVLEIACGSGRNFAHLERAVGPSGRITGFDYSAAMLGAAARLVQSRGWSNVDLVQGDAAVLDLDACQFDGALCVLGVSAIPEWERALERAHAMLRPGGVLAVCDAQLFSGPLAALNPLIRRVYSRAAAWQPGRDIPAAMRRIFGNVESVRYNLGTFVVSRSVRSRA